MRAWYWRSDRPVRNGRAMNDPFAYADVVSSADFPDCLPLWGSAAPESPFPPRPPAFRDCSRVVGAPPGEAVPSPLVSALASPAVLAPAGAVPTSAAPASAASAIRPTGPATRGRSHGGAAVAATR
ncbi:hypothetical protein GCM10028832_35990 [Streptomyces sparsus]